jgi:RNA polymerase sigma-70 factor (ECF subfamily)
LYAFIRRRGFDPERAKDLTQEFFARLLEKNFLMAADREKGRFRSFLLACVQHFLSKELKKERALKRGGGYTFISLDEVMAEGRYAQEPVDRMSPEKIYERGWGLTLLDQALARLKREYVADEKSGLFEALHIFLSGARQAPGSYAEIGVRLNMTESAVRQAAYRMRFRFGVLLRWEVAHTVANPREIEDELGHLLTIMSN